MCKSVQQKSGHAIACLFNLRSFDILIEICLDFVRCYFGTSVICIEITSYKIQTLTGKNSYVENLKLNKCKCHIGNSNIK